MIFKLPETIFQLLFQLIGCMFYNLFKKSNGNYLCIWMDGQMGGYIDKDAHAVVTKIENDQKKLRFLKI